MTQLGKAAGVEWCGGMVHNAGTWKITSNLVDLTAIIFMNRLSARYSDVSEALPLD
jgi:hypothetical protein